MTTTIHQHRICPAADIACDSVAAGNLPDGRRVAIYNVAGSFYASDDSCTHGAASLADDGTLEGCVIECGLHLGSFDVRTGAVVSAPCTKPLRTYPVHVRGGEVWLDLEEKP